MASPSRVATKLGSRTFAGVVILSVVLAFSPIIAMAQTGNVGAYLGYDTPWFTSGSYARVATDDGDGLRLRSGAGLRYEEISMLSDGTQIQVLDGPFYDGESNGWYLVTDGDTTAYAFGGFLTGRDASTAPATTSDTNNAGYLGYDTPSFGIGQTVSVVTDDGSGLRIRTGPNTGAERIATLGDGDIVTIVDGPTYDGSGNGWYLVSNGSLQGFAFAGFLTSSGQSSSASGPSNSTGYLGYETPSFEVGATAIVRTDDGDGLRIRTGPTLDSDAVLSVADGSSVSIINGPYYDEARNGWYAVSANGVSGFVYAGFLSGGSSSSSSAPSSAASSSSGYLGYETPSFSIGQNVKVLTDDGGGLRMRDAASTAGNRLATLGDGDVVTVVDGPVYDGSSNGWYLVSDGAIDGYAFAGFLTATSSSSTSSSASTSNSSTTTEPSGVSRFDIGENVNASESVNVRGGASIVSSKRGTLNTGDTAEIIDGPFYDSDGDDWYYLRSGSLEGFTMGAFLKNASVAASTQKPAAKAFIYPIAGATFTQGFGCSPYSFEPYSAQLGCNYHNAIDLAAPSYTPIVASAAGTVTAAGWCDCGLGYYVTIDHGNGYTTTYGHMAEQPYVSVGQQVAQGETIGPVGSTGMSTGPHTHFTVTKNGIDIDPLSVL